MLAIKTMPIYINMFPKYRGFLDRAYGPEVHNEGAPTFTVLVTPPACETAQILIASPISNKITPIELNVAPAVPAKYIIISAIGMGV